MRVGLLTRMMGGVGIIAGVLFLIPLTPLPVVQALWLVFFGAMLLEFGSRPLPEAWTRREARPWPSAAAARPAARQRRRARRAAARRRARRRRRPSRRVPRGPSPSASKKRKRRR